MINNTYYKFTFSSLDCVYNPMSNADSRMYAFEVYTDDIKKLRLFLEQHNFTEEHIKYVKLCSLEEYLDDASFILKYYKFSSNLNDDTFNVMTTMGIIGNAISLFSKQYAEHMVFGPAIKREDIDVIGIISQLVYHIPYTVVYEDMLIDGNNTEMMESFDTSIFDESSIDDVLVNLTETNISDDLTKEIMPFTIEAYSRLFAELMADDYV